MQIEIQDGMFTAVDRSGPSRLVIDGGEVDLPTDVVFLPGFVDTHCHLMGAGEMAERVDLHGAGSAAECARRMADAAGRLPSGRWILGFGWNQEEWNDPAPLDRTILDAHLHDHPAALYRIDTHAVAINTRAMEAAGIVSGEIEGGRIESDAAGEPTGMLIDSAIRILERAWPAVTDADRERWIELGAAEARRHGLTAVHDMNVEPERLPAMIAVAERGGLGLRVHLFLKGESGAWREIERPGQIADGVTIDGVKFFADGALGSRGALLIEPYSDAPDVSGIELMSPAELVDAAVPAIERGFAIATHAIGDRAVRNVIVAYEELRERYPDALLRMEHAQIVHSEDLVRMARAGIIAAVQPTHCISDASMAIRRLGSERARDAYRWRSLIDAGVTIIAGSDFPVESPSALDGLRAFVDRDPGDGPWYPHERITPEEAVDAFTSAALTGVTFPRRTGRIHPGFAADLTILSGDPFSPRTTVIATLLAGTLFRST